MPVVWRLEHFLRKSSLKKRSASAISTHLSANQPTTLEDISAEQMKRITVRITEFDRVLGGGIVPGSIVLLGGEPGIGKSTLVLQMALGMKSRKVLYVSGEESLQQIKLRAGRLGLESDTCLFLSETSLENAWHILRKIINASSADY